MRLLPNVRHLVNESGQNQFVRPPGEYVRVQGELVRGDVFHAAGEAFRRKVSLGAGMALERHGNVGQRIAEQLGVEEVLGMWKARYSHSVMVGLISVSYDTRFEVMAVYFLPVRKQEGMGYPPAPILLQNFSRVLRFAGCICGCFQPD